MSGIADLLAKLHAETAPGVTGADLDTFETATGLRLPENVRLLYKNCNGASLSKGIQRILSLEGVRGYVYGFRNFGIPQRWGYFPFTDNNDSNPFCVCCASPLIGYVVLVSHDDSAAIKFRSLESFLAAQGGATGGRDLYELPSDFAGEARTAADLTAGRELIALAPSMEDVEQGDAYRFGMWLLSGDQLGEIIAVLKAGDEYVREDALRRLTAIGTPGAQAAIRDSRADLTRFVARCAEALRQAGVAATVEGDTGLNAGPRRAGVNTAMFYARRREPDIFEKLIERFRDG